MRRTLLLMVPCLAIVLPVLAQDGLPLAPGARVRLTVPSRNLEERGGTFEAIVGDTVLVNLLESEATGAAQATPMRIPLDSVTRLDVSHGRHRRTARGAGVGFLVGAAVGAIAGPVSMECPEYGCDTSPAVAAAAGGLVFGGLGALIGLGVGATTTSETWKEVPLAPLRASHATGR